jgi:TonB-linked SusC/RagA family outer membrane protein
MQGIYKSNQLCKAILLVLFMATFLVPSRAQDTTTVKGVIYSPFNEPLPNVSVSISGSLQRPAVTNEAGEFTIVSGSGNDWLIISPTSGYKTKRVLLNHRQNIQVHLTPEDMQSGDDPEPVLSRPVLKKNMSGSFADVNLKEMYHSSAITVDQYLQGQVTGLNVINRSGMPGSGAYMGLRGLNSLNTTSQPLYLVDGIPVNEHGLMVSSIAGFQYNPLSQVNPLDVSKIAVIKDPSVTAAYGSRGSNGIIAIETLDPSVTQTTIEVDLRSGLSLAPSNLIPQLNGDQHKTLMQEVLFSSGKYEEVIRDEYPSLYVTPDDANYIDYQHNTNWQEEIFRNSAFYNANINVKGGDEIASYGLSFGVLGNKGVIRNTNYNGYNLRFVSRLNIFAWLKMNAGVSLNYNGSNQKEAATVEQTSPILAALAKSPMINPYQYDDQGKELKTLTEVDDLGTSNPLAIIENMDAKNTNYSFISTIGAEATINRNLAIKSKFSLLYNVMKEKMFMPNHGMEHYYNNEAINVAKASNNDLKSFYNNTYLSWDKKLGSDHSFSSMTGFQLQTNKYQLDWGIAKNAHESDQYRELQDGQDNLREVGGQNRNWNWLSIYENLMYAYQDKYIVTATVSLDGSSRVGDEAANTLKIGGVPFGLFYSGGLAWRLSSEPFLRDVTWLENLKLRASVGRTGNDDIGESSALNYYKSVKFRETVGLFPAVIPNPELTYETVTQLDGGLDISLLGDRFSATIDVFKSKTSNMLIFKPVEAYLGYFTRMENVGEMTNKGFEVSAFYRVISHNKFKWDVQASLSKVKNEVTNLEGQTLISDIPGAQVANIVGHTANSFYGYIYKGVFSTQEEATAANLVNAKNVAFRAGDAIYEDISGPDGVPDGKISDYDKTVIGKALPDMYGGLSNTFTYGKFSLNIFLQFVTGNDVFNYLRYKNESMTGLENQSQSVLNRWQYEGQVTNVPRALWQDPVGNSAFSTRWIENGSYVRIKNISLSYRIPDKFLTFRNAEVYVAASNMFTFSNYLGYDPEFSYSYSQVDQGVDYGMMPQTRQFIAGIKLGL